MTKKEAIENIKLIRFNAAITNANSFKEALDMAIEALSHPSLPSNLDEAAEKNFETMEVLEHENIFEETHNRIFKAGAEWQLNEDAKKHYFAQLKSIKDAWQELKKINPEIKSEPALCFYKGAEWMAGQGCTVEIDKGYFMKQILDACCGGKMFYFDKNDPRVLFQDIRSFKDKDIYKGRTFSVEPDVVADFTSMPYPDNTFKMVVFDPPHLKYTSEKETKGWQMEKYGWLPRGQWREILTKGFSECFRVLAPGGFLIFKWNETDIKVSEILKLTPEKPIFGHISGKRANTHWICFMKA